MIVYVVNFLLNPYTVYAQLIQNNPSNWNYRFIASSSDSDFFLIMILLMIFIILILYFVIKLNQKRKKNHNETDSRLNKEYVKKEEEIEKVIPNFNLEEFKNMVFEKYQKIEKAYMEFDEETLKKSCTESLFLIYQSKLQSLKRKKYQNRKGDFRQITFRVIDLLKKETKVFLKIRTTIWCYDYIVDQNGSIVKGRENKRCIYEYEMVFEKFINNNSEWLLSKKEIISKK